MQYVNEHPILVSVSLGIGWFIIILAVAFFLFTIALANALAKASGDKGNWDKLCQAICVLLSNKPNHIFVVEDRSGVCVFGPAISEHRADIEYALKLISNIEQMVKRAALIQDRRRVIGVSAIFSLLVACTLTIIEVASNAPATTLLSLTIFTISNAGIGLIIGALFGYVHIEFHSLDRQVQKLAERVKGLDMKPFA
jgi:amino acid transporter